MSDDVNGSVTADVADMLSTTGALGKARRYASAAVAEATQKAYTSDWADFQGWCQAMGVDALPASPGAVGAFLADRAGTLAVATVGRRLASIATAHRMAGHQLDTRHPAIRDVMRGIRRTHGLAQRRAAPATTALVKAMADVCDDGTLIGHRDRALLLVGFAGAFRRSELVAVAHAHISQDVQGIRITIPRSKSDQEGEGQTVGIMRTGSTHCPVDALKVWLELSGIRDGAVFRSIDRHGHLGSSLSDRAVALIVKRRAEAAGLDATLFSGHSLRAGLATSAAAAGLQERHIQRQTRHRSVEQLRRYIRPATVYEDNVTQGIGL